VGCRIEHAADYCADFALCRLRAIHHRSQPSSVRNRVGRKVVADPSRLPGVEGAGRLKIDKRRVRSNVERMRNSHFG
jgi:hypothetical protein